MVIENLEKQLDFTTFDFQHSFLAGDFSLKILKFWLLKI
jgi:hypothetical protein